MILEKCLQLEYMCISPVILQERLQRSEWAAVCVAAVGTIGIGATSADEAAGGEARAPSTARIAGVLGLLCFAALLDCFLRYRRASQDKRSLKTAKPSASTYGLQVGVTSSLNSLARYIIFSGRVGKHAPFLCSTASAPHMTKQVDTCKRFKPYIRWVGLSRYSCQGTLPSSWLRLLW